MTLKHEGLHLHQNVWNSYISPALEESRIKAVAKQLGFGESLTEPQVSQLYNCIVKDLIEKITEYMQSDDARKICNNVHLYDPRPSFSPVIKENLGPRIKAIFSVVPQQTPIQPPSFLQRVFSVF